MAAGTNLETAQAGYIVEEKNGVWQTAEPIPGLAGGGDASAFVNSVSCISPGNCAIGGSYEAPYDGTKRVLRGFVDSETDGVWSAADVLPPPVAQAETQGAAVLSVSCTTAGDCVAGGYDLTDYQSTIAFVAQETDGTWGTPAQITGAPALDGVASVSCTAPGECVAGLAARDKAFAAAIATEHDGTWSSAEAVPGLAGLASDQAASGINSLSCSSTGNCTAAGEFNETDNKGPVFVVTESGGVWDNATALDGEDAYPTVSASPPTWQIPLSCAAPGDCALGGITGSFSPYGFIANQVNGTWNSPTQWVHPLPISRAIAEVTAISCWSTGNCSAGGYIEDPKSPARAFVIDETNGAWGKAVEVVGAGAGAAVTGISCPSAGRCVVYGQNEPSPGAFAASQVTVAATTTTVDRSQSSVSYGNEQIEKLSVHVSSSSGTPTGIVKVKSGAATLCSVSLVSGRGSCLLSATRFAPGSILLTAVYSGPAWFGGSASLTSFKVTRAATRTALHPSAARVRYGHESAEKISVVVTPAHAGSATGTVTVTAGRTTICRIGLRAGKGACVLSVKRLRTGTYTIRANYGGSSNFTGSSATTRLTVAR